ncbi:MAG TPA: STAS domain-containing protein [Acidimicrobiia bacterium]
MITQAEESFSIEVDQIREATVLIVQGEVDLATSPRLSAQCLELAERGRTKVVVDASEVSFIDATGIRAFIEGRTAILKNGSSFNVVPSRQVRRLFDLVDLHEMFPGFSSTDEALDYLEA